MLRGKTSPDTQGKQSESSGPYTETRQPSIHRRVEYHVRRMTLPLVLLANLAACSQAHVDPQSPRRLAQVKEQIDQQECEKTSRYHGQKVFEPFYYFESREKYKECLQRRGHAVTEN